MKTLVFTFALFLAVICNRLAQANPSAKLYNESADGTKEIATALDVATKEHKNVS